MPAITVKNIQEGLYNRLKKSTEINRRSINSELIHCLESMLEPVRITPEKRLVRARALRPHVAKNLPTPNDIRQAIDEGRL